MQRIAVRCLGLFGLLERRPNAELLKQLRISYIKGPHLISIEACKALIDLLMWHGPQEVDRVLNPDIPIQVNGDKKCFCPVNFTDSEGDSNSNVGMLDHLYGGFENDDWADPPLTSNEDECIFAILGEGFAKILLLSDNYPSIPASLHPVLLSKLIYLYFSDVSENLYRYYLFIKFSPLVLFLPCTNISNLIECFSPARLKQCLSVFFENYPCLSTNHKASINDVVVYLFYITHHSYFLLFLFECHVLRLNCFIF